MPGLDHLKRKVSSMLARARSPQNNVQGWAEDGPRDEHRTHGGCVFYQITPTSFETILILWTRTACWKEHFQHISVGYVRLV